MKITWFMPPAIATLALRSGAPTVGTGEIQTTLTISSDAQFEALCRGEMDLAVTAMDNVIGWNRRGEGWDFRMLAQVERTTPLGVVARADVESAADLEGRTVLVDSAENGFVVALLAWMADAGVDHTQVRLVEAGGVRARFEAMLAGEGDATLLGPPFDGLAMEQGLRQLASLNDAYPQFPGQALVARRGVVDRLGDDLGAWLALLEDGRSAAVADPERARADLLASGLPPPAAAALVAAIPQTLRPDRAGVDLVIGHRTRLGLPGGDETWAGLVDERPLEAALARRRADQARP